MSSAGNFLNSTLLGLLSDPGQPRLTWYGGDFERIELSGAVLVNWVNKTTNLLCEEFDAEPGSVITVDLPPHWRFLTWALAALRSGAALNVMSEGGTGVVVTAQPDAHDSADELVVVTLAALARRYPGELPAGAIDAAAAVMTYSDGLGFVQATDTSESAITSIAAQVTYADLPEWALTVTEDPGVRTALRCSTDTVATRVALLQHALCILSTGGSVVLLGSDISQELADDPERFQRIVASEKISSVIEL